MYFVFMASIPVERQITHLPNSLEESSALAVLALSHEVWPKSTFGRCTEKLISPSRKKNFILQKDKLSTTDHMARFK